MTRNSASALAFAASVAAAILAAVLVTSSSSAFADGIASVETSRHGVTPSAEAAPNPLRQNQISADDLKKGYLLCERALDLESFPACSAVYEELLKRVFGGNLTAMIAWLREAWHASAD